MQDNRQRRHIIRAQGRAQLGERSNFQPLNNGGAVKPSSQSAGAAPSPQTTSTERQNSRLLDYLSQSAAGTDRTILDHASTDAVVSSSSAAQLLEAWFNAGTKKNGSGSGSVSGSGAGANSIASGGSDEDGDDIDGLDSTNSEGYWPGGMYDPQSDSNAGRYPGNYSGGYFGTDSGAARAGRNPSRRVQREIEGAHESVAGPSGPGAYLRSLRKIADKAQGPQNKGGQPESRISSSSSPSSHANSNSNSPSKISRCGSPVEVTEEASGSRIETFPTGARVFKDGLGHVREIVSAGGVTVVFKYDDHGHLSAFVRTDASGTIHSLAEADRHGVILRDAAGRVKAQGESMQVDACGCVSIARQDGQFWSLDLVRNVNIERRLLPDEYGNWFSMTALFSSDGFRMATRFRKVKPEDLPMGQVKSTAARETIGQAVAAGATASGALANAGISARVSAVANASGSGKRMVDGTIATLAPGRIDFLSEEDSGNYRFYGRDGSIIDFASDDELKQLKPSCVMPAASREVAAIHRGKRQAGTAWEALREYVFNYLAAL
jgi:hypothetical protein